MPGAPADLAAHTVLMHISPRRLHPNARIRWARPIAGLIIGAFAEEPQKLVGAGHDPAPLITSLFNKFNMVASTYRGSVTAKPRRKQLFLRPACLGIDGGRAHNDVCVSNRPFRIKRFQTIHRSSRCHSRARASLRNRHRGPSIMGFEDEVEQSKGRPCRQTNGRSKRTATQSMVLQRMQLSLTT